VLDKINATQANFYFAPNHTLLEVKCWFLYQKKYLARSGVFRSMTVLAAVNLLVSNMRVRCEFAQKLRPKDMPSPLPYQ
jgi:hypothetical protein